MCLFKKIRNYTIMFDKMFNVIDFLSIMVLEVKHCISDKGDSVEYEKMDFSAAIIGTLLLGCVINVTHGSDKCYSAKTCIHDGMEKCGKNGQGKVRRFIDSCDIKEYNCLKNNDYEKTSLQDCKSLPPLNEPVEPLVQNETEDNAATNKESEENAPSNKQSEENVGTSKEAISKSKEEVTKVQEAVSKSKEEVTKVQEAVSKSKERPIKIKGAISNNGGVISFESASDER